MGRGVAPSAVMRAHVLRRLCVASEQLIDECRLADAGRADERQRLVAIEVGLDLGDAETGARLSWSQTLVRFSVGIAAWLPAGMGYWWSVFDAERRSWTDRASHSRLVRVPKT